jgi:hypothetical protein
LPLPDLVSTESLTTALTFCQIGLVHGVGSVRLERKRSG